jgi:hypothetical protein
MSDIPEMPKHWVLDIHAIACDAYEAGAITFDRLTEITEELIACRVSEALTGASEYGPRTLELLNSKQGVN